MDENGDLECTCDIGVFADCPVCRQSKMNEIERWLKEKPRPKPRVYKAESITSLALHYASLGKQRY